jgi:hypothetical protein
MEPASESCFDPDWMREEGICEISVAQYEKAIQSAFREVADTLAVRDTVDQQVSAQESLVNAAAETYRLANSRYDKRAGQRPDAMFSTRSVSYLPRSRDLFRTTGI